MTLEQLLQDDFIPVPGYAWHVMRVTYGRERAVAEQIAADDCVPYVPKLKVSNLIFLYTTDERIKELTKEMIAFPNHPRSKAANIRIVYDHTRHNPWGGDIPMIIQMDEMRSFILITNVEDEHVSVSTSPESCMKQGDWVEVTDGRFKGVKGHLRRIKHQTCVVVHLEGVCCVSSAYIPKAFIKPINPPSTTPDVE